jgi:hypothetical protein
VATIGTIVDRDDRRPTENEAADELPDPANASVRPRTRTLLQLAPLRPSAAAPKTALLDRSAKPSTSSAS